MLAPATSLDDMEKIVTNSTVDGVLAAFFALLIMGRPGMLRDAARGVMGYLREISGETAYDRYVEHRRRDHPNDPVMSRRDFERWRMDDRDANPRARCC